MQDAKELLIKVYGFAILNCQRHDLVKTNNAIQELINGLKFDGETRETALGLLKLYQFCQDQMRKKNYTIVERILTDLKNAWLEGFQKN